jgi:cation transporter-like permease
MRPDPVTVAATLDQEEVARLFAQYDLLAMPVVDEEGRMKGIVTVDDIVDVVSEEATEDIQKLGGMAALDAPYLQTGIGTMLKKRAGWLAALFLGEMLTASAMAHFEDEIAKAVVLALFVPLIISSGGNSGSQATTLVIRAMALGQVSGRMWFNVLRRELLMGLGLGLILATIGVVRILAWQGIFHMYGEHYALVATTVGLSLIGVVIWGTISGAMLPLIMRRLGFDPASASAPFVATLVDVSGLVIYFSVAGIVLRGTLLSEREQHRPSAATVAHVLAAVNTEVAATAGANGGDKLDVIIAEDEKSHALQVHYVVAEKICASRGARVQADGEVILGDLQREQGGAEQDTRPMQLDDFRKLFESADVRAKCRVGADQPAQESQPAAAPSASQP